MEQHKRVCKYIIWLLTCGIILILKFYFANSRPENLSWILKPVVNLVSLTSGRHFTPIPGRGYLAFGGSILIDTGCAGINFLIILLALSVFTFPLTRLKITRQAGVYLGLLAAAYLVTVLCNTFRITIAIVILNLSKGHLPAAGAPTLHLVIGILYYATCLIIYYQFLNKIHKRILIWKPKAQA